MSAAIFFFFSSRRRHTRWPRDWSSDVCSSDLAQPLVEQGLIQIPYGGLWYAAQILTSSAVPGETRLVELTASIRSEERRVGKEGRARWRTGQWTKKEATEYGRRCRRPQATVRL